MKSKPFGYYLGLQTLPDSKLIFSYSNLDRCYKEKLREIITQLKNTANIAVKNYPQKIFLNH